MRKYYLCHDHFEKGNDIIVVESGSETNDTSQDVDIPKEDIPEFFDSLVSASNIHSLCVSNTTASITV